MALIFQNLTSTILALLLCLGFSFYSFTSADSRTATYYTSPYVPSACYGYEDQGVMIAAASEDTYNDGAVSGQYYQVTCLSGTNEGTPHPCRSSPTVVVKIVYLCPPGSCQGTLNLSQEAFGSIADTDADVINISYQQV